MPTSNLLAPQVLHIYRAIEAVEHLRTAACVAVDFGDGTVRGDQVERAMALIRSDLEEIALRLRIIRTAAELAEVLGLEDAA